MIDKLKNIFQNKDKKKENLISLLIILVITLIIINRIWNDDGIKTKEELKEDAYLATIKSEDISDVNLKIDENENKSGNVNRIKSNDLEERLKKILETLKGVSNVSVMLTYNESSCQVPIYNINESNSKNKDEETTSIEKEVVVDSESNIVLEKVLNPKIEGAIITAKGVSDPTVKGNIISAVEAVTGVMTHKIQVFEMGE